MFEDWKKAWRDAVENFRREMTESADDASAAATHVRAMRREVATARGALERLQSEIVAARKDAAAEREGEEVCRRREKLAANIGDDETVRIAVEFAERHAKRAEVLERKVVVLTAEHALLAQDLQSMEQIVQAQPAAANVTDGGPQPRRPDLPDEERERENRDFGRLEREARERAAEDRLEELKRRMR
jgi:hypothetical protein